MPLSHAKSSGRRFMGVRGDPSSPRPPVIAVAKTESRFSTFFNEFCNRIGGKADVVEHPPECPFLARAGHPCPASVPVGALVLFGLATEIVVSTLGTLSAGKHRTNHG